MRALTAHGCLRKVPFMSRLSLLVILVASLAACDKRSSKPPEPVAASATAPTPTTAAAPATAPAQPTGQTFGAGVKLAETTSVEDILANPKGFKGKSVRVEGMITDVCPKRGCWFEVAGTEPGHKLRFKVTDGEMVFPMEAKGKRAIAEGVIAVDELTLDETRARAAYEAKEYGKPFDPATITEPVAVVRIDGTGAVFQ